MDKQRYTCAEVADMYRVKVRTVWDWVRTGKLHAVKIGKRYLIRPEDLDAFENGKVVGA